MHHIEFESFQNCVQRPKINWDEVRLLAQRMVALLALAVSCYPVLTSLTKAHPLIEFASHFHMHFLGLTCVLLPLVAAMRLWTPLCSLGLAFVVLALNTGVFSLFAGPAPPSSAKEREVSVLSWNVAASNQNFEGMRDTITAASADVLVLLELRPGVWEKLGLQNQYPFGECLPSWGGEGMGVFSRIEGTTFQREDFGYGKQPSIVAQVPGAGEQVLTVVGIHALSPLPMERMAIRNRQLAALRTWAQEQTGPLIVCGDFNITPWTAPFRQLLSHGFEDTRIGYGNAATWPTWLGGLGIPIDHALTMGDCHVTQRKVLPPATGSDHSPLMIHLAF